MSDTSGEDWLAMRLADVGKAWKEDVARLTSRIVELERAAETSRAERAAALGLATARIRELEGEREEGDDMSKRANMMTMGPNLSEALFELKRRGIKWLSYYRTGAIGSNWIFKVMISPEHFEVDDKVESR